MSNCITQKTMQCNYLFIPQPKVNYTSVQGAPNRPTAREGLQGFHGSILIFLGFSIAYLDQIKHVKDLNFPYYGQDSKHRFLGLHIGIFNSLQVAVRCMVTQL